MRVKVRADWIDLERGFILDLKSTTGNCKDLFKTQNKISNYNYDLSAALYLDVFNTFLKNAGAAPLHTFYWGFGSKDYVNFKVYRATPDNLQVGRKKYMKGIELINKHAALGWKFPDEISDIGPIPWEKDLWLNQEGENKNQHSTNKPSVRTVRDGDLL